MRPQGDEALNERDELTIQRIEQLIEDAVAIRKTMKEAWEQHVAIDRKMQLLLMLEAPFAGIGVATVFGLLAYGLLRLFGG